MSGYNDNKPGTDAPALPELGKALSHLSSGMDKLVAETIEAITSRGIDAHELAPLMKLRDAVRALDGIAGNTSLPQTGIAQPAGNPQSNGRQNQQVHHDRDERGSTALAGEALLARASAVIDIMVQSGDNPEHAAQILARQLLVVGVRLPETGGDVRGWKCLFHWRNHLVHHRRTGPAWDDYCAFKDELADIPPDQRLRRTVGERLWDRRKRQDSDRETA